MEELSIPPIFKMAESSRARSQPSSSHPQVIIPNASKCVASFNIHGTRPTDTCSGFKNHK